MGGISNWEDAIEFILAGATAIQVGTYNFIDPAVSVKIVEELAILIKTSSKFLADLIGAMKVSDLFT